MKIILILFFLLASSSVNSQDIFRLNADTISGDDLLFRTAEDTLLFNKKKKRKKNVFFGVKTKKGFIRVAQGRNNIYENFHLVFLGSQMLVTHLLAKEYNYMNEMRIHHIFGAVLYLFLWLVDASTPHRNHFLQPSGNYRE